MNNTINMPALRAELIRDEGLRLQPYKCTAGKLTTGVGRNLDGNPLTLNERFIIGHSGRTRPITKEQAIFLLDNDIKKVMGELDVKLPWWKDLDGVRRRALINMVFNLGITKLLTFKNTLRCIQTGAWESAAVCMLDSLWAMQVGKRANRLAKMVRTGAV